MKVAESFSNEIKTLREKEKLPITNNFCFSHNVFKRLVLLTCKSKGSFLERVNSFPDDKILAWSKFKALADYKVNVT